MEKTKKSSQKGRIIANILLVFLCFIAFLAFFSSVWYTRTNGDTGFDSIIFTLTSDFRGTNTDMVFDYLLGGLLPAIATTVTVSLLLLSRWNRFQLKRWIAVTTCLVLSAALITYASFNANLVQYLVGRIELTNLYETEYVDPDTVTITFPEEKRNLIYISLESMESTFLSADQGGAMGDCMIPELYGLACDNINFSHSEGVGGLVEVPGASWTVGAMVAQTAGVPLITPSNISDWQNGYGRDGDFLPGLTTMGDILHEAGYQQAFMLGSDANFGGQGVLFETHGVEHIYDLYTARDDGTVPEDYYVWWGMEDQKLFDYARMKLPELAASGQPFALTLQTMDTHHVGGYNCQLCDTKYNETYSNAIACSSYQTLQFVKWIQAQDFYENTTIIITGDHFSMDSGYFDRNVAEDYQRHGYNCIINPAAEPVNTTNRQFSSLDMFPTTLAAIGCTIEGDRLGLGVNLFSDQPTLIEEFGYNALCTELSKRTDYYSENFYRDGQ